MYRNFYQLRERPFDHSPDPAFLYLSESHREVLASMVYGITFSKGFILIAGDAGTGKTTLIQALLRELGSEFAVTLINNPRPGFAEIMYQLSTSLGVPYSETTITPQSYHHLKKALENLDKEGKRTALIIDEAHLLSEECLENIRLLSNYETENRKLIQIVLVGQNEIYRTLQQASLKSLKQRIAVNRVLEPLVKQEVEEYIRHRLRVAGREESLYDRKALGMIWEKSGGVPRVINNICDNALMTGYALESKKIGGKIISEVIEEMASGFSAGELSNPVKRPARKLAWAASLVSLIIFAFLIGYVSKIRPGKHSGNDNTVGIAVVQPGDATETGRTPAAPPENPEPPENTGLQQPPPPAGKVEPSEQAQDLVRPMTPDPQGNAEDSNTPSPVIPPPDTETDREKTATDALAPQPDSSPAPSDGSTMKMTPEIAAEQEDAPADMAAEPATNAQGAPVSETHGNDQAPAVPSVAPAEATAETAEPLREKAAAMPNPCLADLVLTRYGIENDTIMDLIQMANPDRGSVAHECKQTQLILPNIEKPDLIRQHPDGAYRIHYATFYRSDDAARWAETLRLSGLNALVEAETQGSDPVFRIFAGPYPTLEETQGVLESLNFDHLPFLTYPQQQPTEKKKMLLEVLKEVQ